MQFTLVYLLYRHIVPFCIVIGCTVSCRCLEYLYSRVHHKIVIEQVAHDNHKRWLGETTLLRTFQKRLFETSERNEILYEYNYMRQKDSIAVSSTLFALGTLRSKGLPTTILHQIARATTLNSNMHASPAWWGYCNTQNRDRGSIQPTEKKRLPSQRRPKRMWPRQQSRSR